MSIDAATIEQYIQEAEAAANALVGILDPAIAPTVAGVEAVVSSATGIISSLYNAITGLKNGSTETWEQVSQEVKDALAAFEAQRAQQNAAG